MSELEPRLVTGAGGRAYRLTGRLGQGGFGSVYRGVLEGEHGFVKPVAVKLLNADSGEAREREEMGRRLRDEARLLALLRHRAIVGVDDLVLIDGRWAIVMEYIEGVDLSELIARGPVPPRPAAELGREVAAALKAAHEAINPETGKPLNIVHRDIKPANLRITAAGDVKVLDFGVARAVFGHREADTRSLLFGTMAYMAPERFDGVDTPAADVYALGVSLLEALRGATLGGLSVNPHKHAREVQGALSALPVECQALIPLLRGMLAYNSPDRPAAASVLRALQDAAARLHGPWLSEWAGEALRSPGAAPRPARPDSGDSLARALSPVEAVNTQLVPSAPPGGPKPGPRPLEPAETGVGPVAPARDRGETVAAARGVSRWPLALALSAGVLVVGVALGLVVFAVVPRLAADPSPASEPPAAVAVAVADEPADDPVPDPEPEPEPDPVEPSTTTPTPEAQPPKEESPKAQPPKEDSSTAPAPPAPRKKDETAQPAAKKESTAPTGKVTVTGAKSAWLLKGGSETQLPASVPVGVYTLKATFANGVTIRRDDYVRVAADQAVSIQCNAVQETCR